MTFLVCLFFVASYAILAIILTFFENYVVGDFENDFVWLLFVSVTVLFIGISQPKLTLRTV